MSQRIQIRRARPSALALALSLMLTALFVYAIARPALPGQNVNAVSAESPLSTQIRMEGMDVHFICHSRCADALQARILAAQCVSEGGAGLILPDGGGYAIIREASSTEGSESLLRSSPGLSLRLQGSAAELAAVADSISFLRAQAVETGSLAAALESGDTDAPSVQALLAVYRTQGSRAQTALAALPNRYAVNLLFNSVSACLPRIDSAASSTTPSSLRLLHSAACGEWLGLLEELRSGGSA